MGMKHLGSMRLILFAGISLFLMLLLSIDGSGRTITVDDDSGGDFTKIQDAINASQDGDTIRVFEGVYYENVVVNRSLSLFGNGSEETKIDGGRSGNVVTITADWVNMSGFTVTGSGGSWQIAGIFVKSDHNRIFENNCSNNNVGINLQGSSNSTIEYNTCSNSNYGIYLAYSSNSTIEYNICLNNHEGIYLAYSSISIIMSNTCSSNIYNGIYLSDSSNSTITYNTCTSNNRFGIYLWNSNNSTISYNTISENRVGIYLRAPFRENTVHYNFIFNNTDYGMNVTNNEGLNVEATNNWWGDTSGPYHSENNSMGRGDKVTDKVDFDPWLDEDGNLVYRSDEPDDEDDDESEDQLIHYFIIVILLALLGILGGIVIRVYK